MSDSWALLSAELAECLGGTSILQLQPRSLLCSAHIWNITFTTFCWDLAILMQHSPTHVQMFHQNKFASNTI